VLPPKSHATKSNWKKPQRPQFNAPRIIKISARQLKQRIIPSHYLPFLILTALFFLVMKHMSILPCKIMSCNLHFLSGQFYHQNIAFHTLFQKKDKEAFAEKTADAAVPQFDENEDIPPESFYCKLDGRLLTDPFYLPCGHFFNWQALDNHLNMSPSCPSCSKYTFHYECKPHHKLKAIVEKWMRKKPFARTPAEVPPPLPLVPKAEGGEEPTELLCPIEFTLMRDPVYSVICKHAFGKSGILRWIASKSNPDCPICHAPISRRTLKSWTAMKEFIDNRC
jgi:hypothetical protein